MCEMTAVAAEFELRSPRLRYGREPPPQKKTHTHHTHHIIECLCYNRQKSKSAPEDERAFTVVLTGAHRCRHPFPTRRMPASLVGRGACQKSKINAPQGPAFYLRKATDRSVVNTGTYCLLRAAEPRRRKARLTNHTTDPKELKN